MRDCSQKLGKSIDCDAICSQSTTLATSFYAQIYSIKYFNFFILEPSLR